MSLKEISIRSSIRLLVSAENLLRPLRSKTGDDVLILEYMLPLGCCVHLTPAYEAIKRRHPERTIAVATRGLGLALLRYNPFLDHLIETPDALASPRTAARSLQASLTSRGIRPGLILTGASDQRSSIAVTAMLASPARRGGFTTYPDLYHRPLTYDLSTSQIANNLRMASIAGASSEHLEPRVFFSTDDVTAARSLIQEVNPQGRPTIVFVTQTSGGQLTGWHTDRFAQVIRHAHEKLGCAVVYVGIEKDRPAIEAIRSAAAGVGSSVAGRTSVTQVAALLAMSDAVVSLDTGTLHVGRAVQTPLVVLGPSWQAPTEWLPLGLPWTRILRGKDIDRKTIPKSYQLDEIEASAVVAALDELFSAYPPSQESRDQRVARSLSAVDHLAHSKH